MKKYADRGRRGREFQVGDQVLLKLTPQIWKKISSKMVHQGLVPKYDGPFEIVKKVGAVAYRLQLPARLKIHPTFHVSFLKPFYQDGGEGVPSRRQMKRAPPTIRTEYTREVEKILDCRVLGQSKKNRRVEYLVKWSGVPGNETSWEKETSLWQFEQQVQEFLASRPIGMLASSSGGGLSQG
ncbi:uncharacterized protein [Elaeis guineensis]|uniref:uncharacterized protein n=1 Tax=Elaeis guineensis var. tenera TaxID=51953 RepID=UPI003C6D5083